MLIFMTGMMGSGKSTVGESLAALMSIPFVDLDREIANRVGMSIPEIFANHGEEFFRAKEQEELKIACTLDSSIVSLGGGALCSGNAWALIPTKAHVVWLKASTETLLERLKGSSDRPLLHHQPEETLRTMLNTRNAWYSKAQFHITTDAKEPHVISREILSVLSGGVT